MKFDAIFVLVEILILIVSFHPYIPVNVVSFHPYISV